MPKVLGQAGISLADAYDVEGSSAGTDFLEAESVHLSHEMGATIFSERIASYIYTLNSGALLQNATWDDRWIYLPNTVSRLVGVSVCVIAAEAGRVANCQVSIETLPTVAEIPVWMWDITDDIETPVRWSRAGAAAAAYSFLRPTVGPALPALCVGVEAQYSGSMIQFRGLTGAFGAGNVTAILQLHVLYAALAGMSSVGLPIPSW